jgi:hypothetical protein
MKNTMTKFLLPIFLCATMFSCSKSGDSTSEPEDVNAKKKAFNSGSSQTQQGVTFTTSASCVFIGYGQQCVDLSVQVPNNGSYTYVWSSNTGVSNETTSSVSVCPTTNTTYEVTVFGPNNLCVTFTKDIKVQNINCGNSAKQHKVTICHIPPGNPSNAHEICVDYHAVDAHLAHGDKLGPCYCVCE